MELKPIPALDHHYSSKGLTESEPSHPCRLRSPFLALSPKAFLGSTHCSPHGPAQDQGSHARLTIHNSS